MVQLEKGSDQKPPQYTFIQLIVFETTTTDPRYLDDLHDMPVVLEFMLNDTLDDLRDVRILYLNCFPV